MFNNDIHKIEPIVLKNVRILSNHTNRDTGRESHPRNFAGIGIPPYNAAGDRNFVIRLDPEVVDVEEMKAAGWNLKEGSPDPRNPEALPPYYLRVKVKYFPPDNSYSRMNPRIIKKAATADLVVDEDNVADLDRDDIDYANMTIKGRWSDTPTYRGVTAYLSKMVVYLREDEDDLSYLMDDFRD